MADKSKTIKNATDKELDELLVRLRKENEVQNLIIDLKRKSTPNTPFGNSVPYDRPEVSTEVPIESLYHKANETLAHYGILGMKWGVRRARGSNGRVKQSTNASDDFKKSRELKKKGAKALSNSELQELTKRLQLEKQLKELSPSEYKKGMKVVKEITAAGTTVASLYALTQTPLGKEVVRSLKKGG